ncbi:hypothetical protein [Mucilaginibacter defluvii]|uniref:hypothetical protein n=1 Tax=Mucilaginibacter defluvii TaxID=1196019 RepID=UPI0031E7E6C6
MKKGTLFSLSLLFGICLLLFACKRDIDNYLHDRKEAPSMLLESAKNLVHATFTKWMAH